MDITRPGAIRLGFDYQDIVALDLIVDVIKHPTKYQWVKVEAYEEAKYLDDVYAKLSDNKIIARQVKYSTLPDDSWDISDLLKKSDGKKSLLKKWFESWERIRREGSIQEISLWTNRKAGKIISKILDVEQKIDYKKIEKSLWKEIINQLGDEKSVKEFLNQFEFRFDSQDLQFLTDSVYKKFEHCGGEEKGWLTLKESLREWAIYKQKPTPNGEITLFHIKYAAQWNILEQLSQDFEIPFDYTIPSVAFHKQLLKDINSTTKPIVINAPPALGKSTYLSFLTKELKKKNIPVIRHHYFLSLRDKTPERFDHKVVIKSLMGEIQSYYYEAIKEIDTQNPTPDIFIPWLRSCGRYYKKNGAPFVIIIDGLDEVFRERSSVEELNKLFNILLPIEEGVVLIVGTQPVQEKYLPQKLISLSPRSAWIDLPLFNKDAIKKWVEKHAEDIRIKLDDDNERQHRLPSLVNSFFDVSQGHPLVLKVTLNNLLKKNQPIHEYQVRNLPKHVNSRDILDYYKRLWNTVDTRAKSILILLSCCPYEWGKENIVEILSDNFSDNIANNDAFDVIRHLFINDSLGWRLFHKSMYIFVRSTEEYNAQKNVISRYVLKWIKEGNSEFLKWSYEWLLEDELGNSEPLINGPNRKWLINLMKERFPNEQIQVIIQRAGEKSLIEKKFDRYVSIGLLADYYHQAVAYEKEGIKKLLFPQILLNTDPIIDNKLKLEAESFDEEEILDYARYLKKRNRENQLQELFSRTNENIKYAEYHANQEYHIKVTTKLAALSSEVDMKRIIDFIKSNRSHNSSLKILEDFCSECYFSKLKSRFSELLLKSDEFTDNELSIIEKYAALLSLRDKNDISDLIKSKKNHNEISIISLYLFNKLKEKYPVIMPSQKILDLPEHEHYKYKDEVEKAFVKYFFCFLANKLQNQNELSEEYLVKLGEYNYPRKFVKQLYFFSDEVYKKLTEKRNINYADIFNYFKIFYLPSFSDDRDNYDYGVSAGKSLITISNILFLIKRFAEGDVLISQDEIQKVIESKYVFRRTWIERYLENNTALLSEEAFEYLLRDTETAINDYIELFAERSIDFALLARISALHNKEEKCEVFIVETIKNTITYGSHKDLYFTGCLEIIEKLYKVGVKDSEEWLIKIIPAILNINEYTDRDETRYTAKDLAETCFMINKNLFLDYYLWLLQNEKYWYAEHAFNHYLQNMDFSDDINAAIGNTAIEQDSLEILKKLAENNNEHAQKTLDYLMNKFGDIPNYKKDYEDSHSYTGREKEDYSALIIKYPPQKFNFYLKEFDNAPAYDLIKPISDWLDYWCKTEKVLEAIKVIEEYSIEHDEYENSYYLFELSMKYKNKEDAYFWLVKAFINRSSWQRYYINKIDFENFCHDVKTNYPEKWEQFFIDSMYDRFSRKIGVSSSQKFHNIVEYLILFDQIDLAKKIAEIVIDFGLELVSPLIFIKPNWLLKYDK